MKRATLATIATLAGVAVLGGGAYAVTQIPGDEPTAGATTEPGVIESPAASESPTASAAPEPSESSVPAESETPAPVDTEAVVEYTEAENEFLYGAHQLVPADMGLSDAELLDAGYEICEQHLAGKTNLEITVLEDLARIPHNDLNLTATNYLC